MNKTHLLFFPIFLLLFSLSTLAQTTVNIIENTEEVTIAGKNLIGDGGGTIYQLPAPGARVTLLAKHEASSLTTSKSMLGNLVLQQYVDGQWETLYQDCPGIVTIGERKAMGITIGTYEESVDYESITATLDRHATQIRFYNTNTGTKKTIKDLRVTMATFIEVDPHTLNMGEVVVGTGDTTATIHVTYCNVVTTQLTSTNPSFRLTANSLAGAGFAQYGTEDAILTFNPTIMGTHTTTLIATDNAGHTDSCNVQIRVTKRTPVFTWQLPETFAVGDTIAAPMTSDCENAMALTTCDGDKLLISCGMLIAKAPGEVEVQALQLGDEEYWYNHQETKTLTITGEVPAPDTIVVRDTIQIEVHDTAIVEVHDTIQIEVHDTIVVHDTIQIEVHDTIVVRDTIVVLDTVTVNNMTTEEKALLTIPTLYQNGSVLIANHEGMIGVAVYNVKGMRVRTYEGDDYIEIPIDDLGSGYFVVSILTASEAYGIAVIIP